VDEHASEWVKQRGLCQNDRIRAKLAHADVGDLVCRFFPYGTEQALKTIAKFHCFGFAFDDVVETAAKDRLSAVTDQHFGMVRMLEAPNCTVLANDPYARALREITGELAALGLPAAYRRWTEMGCGFAAGVVWAAVHRQAGSVPNPDTVSTIRPLDAGSFSYGIGLMELAGGFEVAEQDLGRPEVGLLADIASVILPWDNDIQSYHMEVERNVENINLVTSLVQHNHLDPAHALVQAIRMRNQAMWCYLEHRDRLELVPGAPLQRYVAGLDHLIRGNLDWGNATSRYITKPADNSRLSLCEQPTREIDGHDLTEPLDLPSIRWWWTDLREEPR
jgi:terpene synthase-like protein